MTTRKAQGRGRTRRASGRSAAQEWVGLFAGERAARFDLGADLEMAEAVGRGLPTRAVDAAVRSGILEAEDVHRLVVSKRTLQRRRDEHRLSPEESDKLARVVRAVARAEVALGDAAKAERWIRLPNRALDGHRPLDLLGSDGGARAVEKVLGRIEHGVFS